VQPIKELSSAAGRCVGKGCALIRQLANADGFSDETDSLLHSSYYCKIKRSRDGWFEISECFPVKCCYCWYTTAIMPLWSWDKKVQLPAGHHCGVTLGKLFTPVFLCSGVARFCCEEGQSWRLCHGTLAAGFMAGCSRLLDD